MTLLATALTLFAQAKDKAPAADNGLGGNTVSVVIIVVALVAALIFIVFLFLFFSFIRLWIQALLTKAEIGIGSLIGMKLRNVDYADDRAAEDRAGAGRREGHHRRPGERTTWPAATCRRRRRR